MLRLAAAALLVASAFPLMGCLKPSARDARVDRRSPTPPKVAAEELPPAAATPGFAYFATPSGVVAMDLDGRMTLVRATRARARQTALLRRAPDGFVYLVQRDGSSVAVKRLEGATAVRTAKATADVVCPKPRDCAEESTRALDDRGRTWTFHEGRLVVSSAREGTTTYPIGSLPFVDTNASSVAVVGGGPRLPEAPAVKTAESVRGRVVVAGAPLANALVEICPVPRVNDPITPCSKNHLRLIASTNESGVFEVANVPVGTYGFTYRRNATWFLDAGAVADLRPGLARDLGTLRYY